MIRYWFDGGMRYERPDGSHVFHVATTAYRADFDVYRGTFLGFELQELSGNGVERSLLLHEPPASMPLHLSACLQTGKGLFKTGDRLSGDTQPYVMDNGPLLHQTKIDRLAFDGIEEEQPDVLRACYEMLFWEDCIYVIADIAVSEDMPVETVEMKFTLSPGETWSKDFPGWACASASPERHLGVMPCFAGTAPQMSAAGNELSFTYAAEHAAAAPNRYVSAVKLFAIRGDASRGHELVEEERRRVEAPLSFEVRTIAGVEAKYAGYDAMRGYDKFVMTNNHEPFQFRTFPDELERYSYRWIGDGASCCGTRRIMWQRHGDPGTEQYEVKNEDIWRPWGSQAIHRDGSGMPTGHRLQISKNFHEFDEYRKPYSHCWLHVCLEQSLAELAEPNEMAIAYGNFYDVLPAQIVQLSLMGWDDNHKYKGGKKAILGQLWHQGIYGASEVFCLSPESIHTDNMYTDWRPIRTGRKGERWAPNYGGGDMMRYVAEDSGKDRKGLFVAPRVEHVLYGPLLTHLRYAMVSEDGAVQATVEHVLSAGDDMARVFVRTRYRWVRDARLSDFTLFSLGAERYNPAIMNKMSAGHLQQLMSNDTFRLGAYGEASKGELEDKIKRFVRSGDWFVQQGVQPEPASRKYGNEAARGLIVRHIAANVQLHPELSFAAVPVKQPVSFMKEPKETVRIEIRPEIPHFSGYYDFRAGDELEMDGEIVVYCTQSDDYDGANDYFIAMLDRANASASGYLPALYEAVHGEVELIPRRGAVSGEELLPIIFPDGEGVAEVTLVGGFGCYPLRIRTRLYTGRLQVSEDIGGSWMSLETSRPSGGMYQADYREELGCYDLVYSIASRPEQMNKLRRTFRMQV